MRTLFRVVSWRVVTFFITGLLFFIYTGDISGALVLGSTDLAIRGLGQYGHDVMFDSIIPLKEVRMGKDPNDEALERGELIKKAKEEVRKAWEDSIRAERKARLLGHSYGTGMTAHDHTYVVTEEEAKEIKERWSKEYAGKIIRYGTFQYLEGDDCHKMMMQGVGTPKKAPWFKLPCGDQVLLNDTLVSRDAKEVVSDCFYAGRTYYYDHEKPRSCKSKVTGRIFFEILLDGEVILSEDSFDGGTKEKRDKLFKEMKEELNEFKQ